MQQEKLLAITESFPDTLIHQSQCCMTMKCGAVFSAFELKQTFRPQAYVESQPNKFGFIFMLHFTSHLDCSAQTVNLYISLKMCIT